jgi:hypothetical protein
VEANGLQKLKNQGRIGLIIEGRITDGSGDGGAPRAIDHNLGVEVFEEGMEGIAWDGEIFMAGQFTAYRMPGATGIHTTHCIVLTEKLIGDVAPQKT